MISVRTDKLTTKIVICLTVWLVFAALALAIGLKITDWLKYRKLSNGVGVYGKVIAKEPENHRTVRYSYVVGPQTFVGAGHGGRGNPSFIELKIGDPVRVYYDTEEPSISCMGYPWVHQQVEMGGIIFLVVLLPLFPLTITIILIVLLPKYSVVAPSN